MKKKAAKRRLAKARRSGRNGSPSESNPTDALQCTISYNRYGGYCIPLEAQERPAASAVLSGRVYEPRTISFMRKKCGRGDIIHAGTFFGDFLPGLAGALRPKQKIWAFEPNPDNFRCAQITTIINGGLPNVNLFNAGLGDKRGAVAFRTRGMKGRPLGGACHVVPRTESESDVQVQIVTIDQCVPADRKVSILQLDVEGYEEPALKGAAKTIKRCRPILIVEQLRNSRLFESNWFQKHILDAGYRPTDRLHGNVVLVYDR